MIITISGTAGSGKSTVAETLANILGYKFYSMGDLRGKMAQERGLTIDELNQIGKTEDWTDKKVDEYQEKLGKTEDNFVIDGWISYHFIRHSVKVFLETDIRVAAERVYQNQRPDEPHQKTVEGVQKMLETRMKESSDRYKEYYDGIDYLDRKNYDLVLDTTHITAEQAADKIAKFIKKR